MARLFVLVVAVAAIFGVGAARSLPAQAQVAPPCLATWGVFGSGAGASGGPYTSRPGAARLPDREYGDG